MSFESLLRAAHTAARGKKKGRRVAEFMMDVEAEVIQLHRELVSGTYRPRGYRTFGIRYPKPRTISAADFRDRVVHHALCAGLEPMFERFAIFDSYACRPNKGGLRALRRAQAFSRRFPYVLRLDVYHFFETVDHDVLLARLGTRVSDVRVMALLERFVRAGAPGSPAGLGLPIGNLTSQHFGFGNFLLGFIDHFIKERLRVRGYLRYLDDFVLFGDSKPALWFARDAIGLRLEQDLKQRLRSNVTRLMPVKDGFPFLGFRIWPRVIRFDPRRLRRYRAQVRRIERAVEEGRLDESEAAVSTQGLIGWARHADTLGMRASLMRRLEEGALR
ncbi:MAG: reverse transcriptase domain-containing protein [Myxococcota bacterium]